MSTPPVTLSLMVTNADELATMLAVLNQHTQRSALDTETVARLIEERNEAQSLAVGWQRSAEDAQNRFIVAANQITELSEHAESLATQLEQAQQQANEWSHRLAAMRAERDELSELLAKANEKLDGGRNQPITIDPSTSTQGRGIDVRGNYIANQTDWERHRLLGGVADLHPDEDPHDHDTGGVAGNRETWTDEDPSDLRP